MTTPMREAAAEFLAHHRVAVTGVSRNPAGHGANAVYKRLRDRGYEVFAVNPNAETVEGDPAYASLSAIPGGVEAVVLATRPDRTPDAVKECEQLGIKEVWMHRAFGEGSVCEEAVTYGREHGLRVIDGGCPLMFGDTADVGHKVLRALVRKAVPREV
jgi:predicted CoA-binding protein